MGVKSPSSDGNPSFEEKNVFMRLLQKCKKKFRGEGGVSFVGGGGLKMIFTLISSFPCPQFSDPFPAVQGYNWVVVDSLSLKLNWVKEGA